MVRIRVVPFLIEFKLTKPASSLKYCAWACPYGARELDEDRQVMTKCTLCVDRIYSKTLPEAERKPACVLACPTSARIFGDVHDPQSEAAAVKAEN